MLKFWFVLLFFFFFFFSISDTLKIDSCPRLSAPVKVFLLKIHAVWALKNVHTSKTST